jgi:hypothetical protein
MSWLRSRIKTRKTIELSLTADDWDLYTSKEGAEACALRLNQLLEQCVNYRMGMKDTYYRMINEMQTESAFGAADSEPLRVLDDVLELVYGDSDV